jgi:hypothetical protein
MDDGSTAADPAADPVCIFLRGSCVVLVRYDSSTAADLARIESVDPEAPPNLNHSGGFNYQPMPRE